MAYTFGGRVIYETERLDHNPNFKKRIDDLVASSRNITCVGWKPASTFSLFDRLCSFADKLYIIEIHKPNIQPFDQARYPQATPILGSVVDYEKYIPPEHRELLIWQQGPEHLSMEESRALIERMKTHFRKLVIETPNGYYEQGVEEDNIYEIHLSHWHPADFEALGFHCSPYGGHEHDEQLIGCWSVEDPFLPAKPKSASDATDYDGVPLQFTEERIVSRMGQAFVDRERTCPQAVTMDFWQDHPCTRTALESSDLVGRILDFGCGSGEITIHLGRNGRTIVGADISPHALHIAESQLAKEKPEVRTRVSFVRVSGLRMNFPDQSFDSIFCSHVLQYIAHPTPVLRELARVLKPGGRLTMLVPQGNAYYDYSQTHLFDSKSLETLLDDFFEEVEITVLPETRQIKAICRNTQVMDHPQIICQMRVKNEERWLKEVLDGIARVADGIVILDDNSTDHTPMICKFHPAVIEYRKQVEPVPDQRRDKNTLLKMACAHQPDWLLSMDGDEILEASAPQRIFDAIRNCPADVSALSIQFLYMWNDRQHYRTDGIYRRIYHERLFRTTGQDLDSLHFPFTEFGANGHCGSVPIGLNGRIEEIDVKVIHLGYMYPDVRHWRYERLRRRDPKQFAEGHYDHVIDQPGQTLEEWHERPLARKTKVPEMAVSTSTSKQEIKPEYYYANARRNLVELVPASARRVLDVGCGQGMTGGLLRAERGIEVMGIEIHPEVAKTAEQHLSRVIVGDLETMDLPIPDGYFDCIIMGDVLEHLVNPWASLKKLLRVMNPSGTIIASIPNIRNLGIIKKLLEGSWTYEEWGILDKTHLRFFAYKDMLAMFEHAGLDVKLAEVVRDPLFEKEMAVPPQTPLDVDMGKLLLRSVQPNDLNELTAQQFIFTGTLKATQADMQPVAVNDRRPEVSVIIPVWNNLHYTRQCITSLFTVKEPVDFEVIVVNNGSTDGTAEFLTQLPAVVKTVSLPENLGFAKGCNAGANVARGRYLVFLNNDTIVQPGWLKEMLICCKADPTIGLVGNLQVFPDSGMVQQAGIVCGSDHMVYSIYHNQLSADHPIVNKPREFQFIAGSCMLIERDLFQTLHGFDETYLNSCEDVDLCMKVRDAGKKVYYCPQSRIFHYESKTVSGHPKDSANYRRFLERWKDRMKRDDFNYFCEDGFSPNADASVATDQTAREPEQVVTPEESPIMNQTMPKVGILTTFNQRCGLANYARSLAEALKAQGIEPAILAEQTEDRLGQDPPNVHRCWTRTPDGGQDIVRLVQSSGINVLHVNFGGIFSLDGWLANVMKELRSRGVRIVTTFHTTECVSPKMALLARYSDRIIAHHPQNELELVACGGPIHRFEWIPLGMPPVAAEDLFEAKLKLGLDPAQKVVSTFGFIESHKGILELISAMKPVVQHLKAHLHVLGGPHPFSDDPHYMDECRQRAKDVGISEYVHLSGEYIPDDEVALRLQASDAIVLNYQSTRYEGSAAVMEALASGRPVITSSVPTFDLPSALTFKLTKEFNLSEAIYDVLVNPFIAQVLRKNVLEYEKTARWDVIARRHMEVYQRVIDEPAQLDIDFNAYYRTHPDEIYAEPLQRERVRWLKSKAEGRILEIGPATGYVSQFVGASAAVDINRGRLAVCEALRPGIQFLYGNVVEGLPFKDKEFDQVMAPEILEHMDFDQAVTVLKECLRVGKRVLITIPNADKPDYNPDLIHNYEHRWIVNRQSLDRLLAEAGCTNYELDTSADLDFYLLSIQSDIDSPRVLIHERAAMLPTVELDPGEPLHIAMDVSAIENPTIFDDEIARYSANQFHELMTIRPHWTFSLFGIHPAPQSKTVRELADFPNADYRIWSEFTQPMPDVLYLSNPMNDIGKQVLETVFNADLFVAATFDHLYPLVFADEALTGNAELRTRYLTHLELVKRRVNLFLCGSQHTAMDLQARMQVSLARLRIVHAGADSGFLRSPDTAVRDRELSRLHLTPGQFMLSVGVPDQRRNIVGTLLGLAAARQVTGQDYRLVIAGELPGSLEQHVHQMAAQCKLPDGAIQFVGSANDDVLNLLYHSASALLNPSRYEGLCISILHAMTAGLPVIAGHNSAQAESFEGAARLVDADRAESIAQAIMDLHQNPALRNELIQNGYKYSRRFTWRKTAGKTAMYLSESLSRLKAAERPQSRQNTTADSVA